MNFHPTSLEGLLLVEITPIVDCRGFFARTFCEDEFSAHGLASNFPQSSISYNPLRGTLRGLHYQADLYSEAKLVRCTSGAVFDVAVDLRENSPTFCQWHGQELSATNRYALYIPSGFAHGFETTLDNTEVVYSISERYHEPFTRGLRYDDPAFGIVWPLPVKVISDRDLAHPNFSRETFRWHD